MDPLHKADAICQEMLHNWLVQYFSVKNHNELQKIKKIIPEDTSFAIQSSKPHQKPIIAIIYITIQLDNLTPSTLDILSNLSANNQQKNLWDIRINKLDEDPLQNFEVEMKWSETEERILCEVRFFESIIQGQLFFQTSNEFYILDPSTKNKPVFILNNTSHFSYDIHVRYPPSDAFKNVTDIYAKIVYYGSIGMSIIVIFLSVFFGALVKMNLGQIIYTLLLANSLSLMLFINVKWGPLTLYILEQLAQNFVGISLPDDLLQKNHDNYSQDTRGKLTIYNVDLFMLSSYPVLSYLYILLWILKILFICVKDRSTKVMPIPRGSNQIKSSARRSSISGQAPVRKKNLLAKIKNWINIQLLFIMKICMVDIVFISTHNVSHCSKYQRNNFDIINQIMILLILVLLVMHIYRQVSYNIKIMYKVKIRKVKSGIFYINGKIGVYKVDTSYPTIFSTISVDRAKRSIYTEEPQQIAQRIGQNRQKKPPNFEKYPMDIRLHIEDGVKSDMLFETIPKYYNLCSLIRYIGLVVCIVGLQIQPQLQTILMFQIQATFIGQAIYGISIHEYIKSKFNTFHIISLELLLLIFLTCAVVHSWDIHNKHYSIRQIDFIDGTCLFSILGSISVMTSQLLFTLVKIAFKVTKFLAKTCFKKDLFQKKPKAKNEDINYNSQSVYDKKNNPMYPWIYERVNIQNAKIERQNTERFMQNFSQSSRHDRTCLKNSVTNGPRNSGLASQLKTNTKKSYFSIERGNYDSDETEQKVLLPSTINRKRIGFSLNAPLSVQSNCESEIKKEIESTFSTNISKSSRKTSLTKIQSVYDFDKIIDQNERAKAIEASLKEDYQKINYEQFVKRELMLDQLKKEISMPKAQEPAPVGYNLIHSDYNNQIKDLLLEKQAKIDKLELEKKEAEKRKMRKFSLPENNMIKPMPRRRTTIKENPRKPSQTKRDSGFNGMSNKYNPNFKPLKNTITKKINIGDTEHKQDNKIIRIKARDKLSTNEVIKRDEIAGKVNNRGIISPIDTQNSEAQSIPTKLSDMTKEQKDFQAKRASIGCNEKERVEIKPIGIHKMNFNKKPNLSNEPRKSSLVGIPQLGISDGNKALPHTMTPSQNLLASRKSTIMAIPRKSVQPVLQSNLIGQKDQKSSLVVGTGIASNKTGLNKRLTIQATPRKSVIQVTSRKSAIQATPRKSNFMNGVNTKEIQKQAKNDRSLRSNRSVFHGEKIMNTMIKDTA